MTLNPSPLSCLCNRIGGLFPHYADVRNSSDWIDTITNQ